MGDQPNGSRLDQFLLHARDTHENVIPHVESLFDELQLPWQKDDTDWIIDSDICQIRCFLGQENRLCLYSSLGVVKEKDKKNGEFYGSLLRENWLAQPSFLALCDLQDGSHLLVAAVLPLDGLTKPQLANTLESFLMRYEAMDDR